MGTFKIPIIYFNPNMMHIVHPQRLQCGKYWWSSVYTIQLKFVIGRTMMFYLFIQYRIFVFMTSTLILFAASSLVVSNLYFFKELCC